MLSLKKKHPIAAKRSNRVLTVFFKTSEPPLVWHFDLEKNHSFSLSLHRQEGEWELGVTNLGETFQPVAHFDDYDLAENALVSIQTALMDDPKTVSPLRANIRAGIIAIIAVILISAGAYFFGKKTLSVPEQPLLSQEEPAAQSAPQSLNASEQGVPVFADDALGTNEQK